MSLKYHGVIIPEGTDLADGPKAFRDLTDFGNAIPQFATLTERDAWTSPPDGALCVVLKSSGVAVNALFQYTVSIGWQNYDTTPIGVVSMWSTPTPPVGWLVCNGQVVPAGPQYDALRALVGANVPDLRDRFVIGAGGPSLNATGGSATATLAIANMPSHNHGGTTGNDAPDHAHNGSTSADGIHAHNTHPDSVSNINIDNRQSTATPPGPAPGWYHGIGSQITDSQGTHTHSVSVTGATARHQHGVNAQGSGTAFSITPPYYALAYIIKAR